MLDWFFDLSPIVRALAALVLLGISTGLFFAGILWPWGWAVGGVMLVLSIPGKKNQWGDW